MEVEQNIDYLNFDEKLGKDEEFEQRLKTLFFRDKMDELKKLLKNNEISKELFDKNRNSYSSFRTLKIILENRDKMDDLDPENLYNVTKSKLTQSNKNYLFNKGVFAVYSMDLYEIAYSKNNIKYFEMLHQFGFDIDVEKLLAKEMNNWGITDDKNKLLSFMLTHSMEYFNINKFIEKYWEEIDINLLEDIIYKNKNFGELFIDKTYFFNKSINGEKKRYWIAKIFLFLKPNIDHFTEDIFKDIMFTLTKPVEYGDDLSYYACLISIIKQVGKLGFDIYSKSREIFEIIMERDHGYLIYDFIKYNVDLDYQVDDNWLIKNMIKKLGENSFIVNKLINSNKVDYSIEK